MSNDSQDHITGAIKKSSKYNKLSAIFVSVILAPVISLPVAGFAALLVNLVIPNLIAVTIIFSAVLIVSSIYAYRLALRAFKAFDNFLLGKKFSNYFKFVGFALLIAVPFAIMLAIMAIMPKIDWPGKTDEKAKEFVEVLGSENYDQALQMFCNDQPQETIESLKKIANFEYQNLHSDFTKSQAVAKISDYEYKEGQYRQDNGTVTLSIFETKTLSQDEINAVVLSRNLKDRDACVDYVAIVAGGKVRAEAGSTNLSKEDSALPRE